LKPKLGAGVLLEAHPPDPIAARVTVVGALDAEEREAGHVLGVEMPTITPRSGTMLN